MGRFDLEISYRKSADLWLNLQSNCVPERDAVVRELMEYIQVSLPKAGWCRRWSRCHCRH